MTREVRSLQQESQLIFEHQPQQGDRDSKFRRLLIHCRSLMFLLN